MTPNLRPIVYTPEDVALAIYHGFDGVVISNHGGRQLDTVPATLDALRDCAPVAKGKIPIAIDGGIRRGTDIFKAIALGADLCLAGRIPIWGLAVNTNSPISPFFSSILEANSPVFYSSTTAPKASSWRFIFSTGNSSRPWVWRGA